MKVVIVIPTYNEAENIEKLVPVLYQQFLELPQHNFSVLIVDGNSPDAIDEVVSIYKEKYQFLTLIKETEKAGLGAAYTYAFNYALENMAPDVVMEMDADFQHDPKEIKNFIKSLEEGADYVLGSRFMEGGSIPEHWALYRKLLSRWGNIFSRVVLGLYKINDFTTGYRALRVKGYLDTIDMRTLPLEGFAYKIALLHRVHKMGGKIVEIPITFGLRTVGESKLDTKGEILDSLRIIIGLRIKENISFIKFCLVGFAGLGTDASLFNLLRIALSSSSYASYISGFVAMFVTFILNNNWSFSAKKMKTFSQQAKSFPLYAISSYVPIIFRSWLIGFATTQFADNIIVANTAFFIGILVGLIWNFTVYNKIIWKN